jgi:hypothetical protein
MEKTVKLLLPRLLYGDYETTGQAWGTVLDAGSKDPDGFSAHLRNLRMVPYEECPGKLVLHDLNDLEDYHPHGSEPSVAHWRLNWVSQGLATVRVGGLTHTEWTAQELTRQHASSDWYEKADAVSEVQRRLIVAGMEELWFTIAMLYPNRDSFAFWPPSTWLPPSGFPLAILRRLVFWLPEVVPLLPNFYYGITTLVPCKDPDNPEMWWSAWAFLFHLICTWRPAVDFVGLRESIQRHYGENVIEGLLEHAIIEETSGRYRLKE